MTDRQSVYIGDKIEEAFRRNEYDAAPEEIDHDVWLDMNYIVVEFHEPPKWKQHLEEDNE